MERVCMNCPRCGGEKINFLYDAGFGWKAFRCISCGELFFVKGEKVAVEERGGEGDEA
ncbi:MAG: hypothetical protein V6S10_05525 [Candidatus Methanoglobus sp.]